jgi:hypothetical protein
MTNVAVGCGMAILVNEMAILNLCKETGYLERFRRFPRIWCEICQERPLSRHTTFFSTHSYRHVSTVYRYTGKQ